MKAGNIIIFDCETVEEIRDNAMERMDIDFLALEQEVISFINLKTTWVLATAAGQHVTARTVYTVSNGFVIFFITDKNSTKYKQMSVNPNVALCRENYQIEGQAKEIGCLRDLKNSAVGNLFRQHHPSAYKRYALLETEFIFEIHPTQVTIWRQTETQAYRDILMLVAKKAYREPFITFTA